MKFTSNIIVALLLVVSGSSVTAAQEFSNLRGGRDLHEGKEPWLPPSPPEFPNDERFVLDDDLRGGLVLQEGKELSGSTPSPPEFPNDAFPNHERFLLDGCKGLDSKVDLDTCRASGNPCPTSNICCKSVFNIFWTDYYCY